MVGILQLQQLFRSEAISSRDMEWLPFTADLQAMEASFSAIAFGAP